MAKYWIFEKNKNSIESMHKMFMDGVLLTASFLQKSPANHARYQCPRDVSKRLSFKWKGGIYEFIEEWRIDYNERRPHTFLGGMRPRHFTKTKNYDWEGDSTFILAGNQGDGRLRKRLKRR